MVNIIHIYGQTPGYLQKHRGIKLSCHLCKGFSDKFSLPFSAGVYRHTFSIAFYTQYISGRQRQFPMRRIQLKHRFSNICALHISCKKHIYALFVHWLHKIVQRVQLKCFYSIVPGTCHKANHSVRKQAPDTPGSFNAIDTIH